MEKINVTHYLQVTTQQVLSVPAIRNIFRICCSRAKSFESFTEKHVNTPLHSLSIIIVTHGKRNTIISFESELAWWMFAVAPGWNYAVLAPASHAECCCRPHRTRCRQPARCVPCARRNLCERSRPSSRVWFTTSRAWLQAC